MTDYRVIWEIDVEADNPRAAALHAKWMQKYGDWSSVFTVSERDGPVVSIDLDEDCSDEELDALENSEEPPE